METIYYNLDAKRLTVYDMASGESAPQPRSYTCIRKSEPQTRPGQVLDLDAYRRKLAGETAESSADASVEVPQPRAGAEKRTRRFALSLDLCATVAVVVMAVVVVSQFVHIF